MSTHTHGPWEVAPEARTHGETEVIQSADGKGNIVAYIEGQQFPHAEANGRLLAAAPELLAALRDFTHQIEIGTLFDQHGHSAKMLKAYADARAVIAKVEGQS